MVPPDLPPSGPLRGSDPMFDFNIFKLHQKHGQDSQKNIFRGWYPLIYPLQGVDPMCEFNILKMHQNEDICKKLEDSIPKNMDRILKKPFFRGWYPLIYPLQGV